VMLATSSLSVSPAAAGAVVQAADAGLGVLPKFICWGRQSAL
jgi:hypothetical protein